MAEDRTLTISMRADVAELKKGMKEAATSVSSLEKSVANSQRDMSRNFGALRKSSSDMTSALRFGFTSIATYIGGTQIKSAVMSFVNDAIKLESAFASVLKTVDGTASQLDSIRKELLNVSTATGEAATSLYETAGIAGQLGIKTKNITQFTKAMSEMGVTTNMTSEEAAMGFSRWANITGLAETEISNLTSAVVALGNDSGAMESDILDMSLRFAGAAKSVKATDAEIAALSATLREVGLETELGGSAMSRIFRDVAQAVATGNSKLELFAALAGMSTNQFQKAFNSNATSAILDMAEGFKRFRDSGEDAFTLLDKMGFEEIRLSQTFQGLASNVSNARDNVKLATQAFAENTARTEEAQKRYQTTEYELKKLTNTTTALRVEMMGSFMDSIKANISGFRELIQDVRTYNTLLEKTGGILGSLSRFSKQLSPFTAENPSMGWGLNLLAEYYKQRKQVDLAIQSEGMKTAPSVGKALSAAIEPGAIAAGQKAGRMLTKAYGDAVGGIFGGKQSADLSKVNQIMAKDKQEQWGKFAEGLMDMFKPEKGKDVWGDIAQGIADLFSGDTKPALNDILDVNKDITDEMYNQAEYAKEIKDFGEGTSYRTGEYSPRVGGVFGGGGGVMNNAVGMSAAGTTATSSGNTRTGADNSIPLLQGILDATRMTAMNTQRSQVAVLG